MASGLGRAKIAAHRENGQQVALGRFANLRIAPRQRPEVPCEMGPVLDVREDVQHVPRRDDGRMTWLAWLRLPPGKASSRQMLQHIDRLKILHAIDLPAGLDRRVHRNRLLKIAREGAQMTPNDLAKFETQRRHATLVAIVLEATATVTDEIVDLHDRIMGRLFNAAKKKHQQQFHRSGKAINDKVRLFGKLGRALLQARQDGGDAFRAIESVMSWDAFTKSVGEAEQLAQPEAFDFLYQIGDHCAGMCRLSSTS
jgi:hypothetical protein